jgi:predicted amidohydrolase
MVELYSAAVIQSSIRVSHGAHDVAEAIRANLKRNTELIDYIEGEGRLGGAKLVVFPEFFLTGAPEGFGKSFRTLKGYQDICIEIPGEYTDVLAKKAAQYGIYIVGNSYERDESLPGRVLNTDYIIDPRGRIALKYRKLNAAGTGFVVTTNPPDIYDEYVKRYGEDSLFPVLDTDIGKLGCMTCFDVNFPEVARILAMRGAEIICMPTGDTYSAHFHELFRIARARENSVYVVCASHGDTNESIRPKYQQRGYSNIIDYRGNVIEVIDGPGEAVISAQIDIDALRRFRSTPSSYNLLPQVKAEFYAKYYAKSQLWPLNVFLERPIMDTKEGLSAQKRVIDRMLSKMAPETAVVSR